ncbi:hypothetical protein HDU98_006317 [Podochytrium sp. JEL0797]|nr:hypothetical protein HDU98_006317 [Podochytrium sp. JEL0797]
MPSFCNRVTISDACTLQLTSSGGLSVVKFPAILGGPSPAAIDSEPQGPFEVINAIDMKLTLSSYVGAAVTTVATTAATTAPATPVVPTLAATVALTTAPAAAGTTAVPMQGIQTPGVLVNVPAATQNGGGGGNGGQPNVIIINVSGNVVPGNVLPGNVVLGSAPGNAAPANVAPGNSAPGNVAPANPLNIQMGSSQQQVVPSLWFEMLEGVLVALMLWRRDNYLVSIENLPHSTRHIQMEICSTKKCKMSKLVQIRRRLAHSGTSGKTLLRNKATSSEWLSVARSWPHEYYALAHGTPPLSLLSFPDHCDGSETTEKATSFAAPLLKGAAVVVASLFALSFAKDQTTEYIKNNAQHREKSEADMAKSLRTQQTRADNSRILTQGAEKPIHRLMFPALFNRHADFLVEPGSQSSVTDNPNLEIKHVWQKDV